MVCSTWRFQSHPPTSFRDPIGTMETNVMGSANLIQVIQDHQPDCKLMFCSTSEVYGNVGQDGRKIHWNDSIVPSNPYGASKALAGCLSARTDEQWIHQRIHYPCIILSHRTTKRTYLLYLI